jgi:hypothetical protein
MVDVPLLLNAHGTVFAVSAALFSRLELFAAHTTKVRLAAAKGSAFILSS